MLHVCCGCDCCIRCAFLCWAGSSAGTGGAPVCKTAPQDRRRPWECKLSACGQPHKLPCDMFHSLVLWHVLIMPAEHGCRANCGSPMAVKLAMVVTSQCSSSRAPRAAHSVLPCILSGIRALPSLAGDSWMHQMPNYPTCRKHSMHSTGPVTGCLKCSAAGLFTRIIRIDVILRSVRSRRALHMDLLRSVCGRCAVALCLC